MTLPHQKIKNQPTQKSKTPVESFKKGKKQRTDTKNLNPKNHLPIPSHTSTSAKLELRIGHRLPVHEAIPVSVLARHPFNLLPQIALDVSAEALDGAVFAAQEPVEFAVRVVVGDAVVAEELDGVVFGKVVVDGKGAGCFVGVWLEFLFFRLGFLGAAVVVVF